MNGFLKISDNLAEFEEIYEIKNIKPVDMFPFTSHIEVVVSLCKKG
jgi:tRNA/tmRNA/rRNA uracil-C5-methylase (TrmA/RlmC/RlmD family)